MMADAWNWQRKLQMDFLISRILVEIIMGEGHHLDHNCFWWWSLWAHGAPGKAPNFTHLLSIYIYISTVWVEGFVGGKCCFASGGQIRHSHMESFSAAHKSMIYFQPSYMDEPMDQRFKLCKSVPKIARVNIGRQGKKEQCIQVAAYSPCDRELGLAFWDLTDLNPQGPA